MEHLAQVVSRCNVALCNSCLLLPWSNCVVKPFLENLSSPSLTGGKMLLSVAEKPGVVILKLHLLFPYYLIHENGSGSLNLLVFPLCTRWVVSCKRYWENHRHVDINELLRVALGEGKSSYEDSVTSKDEPTTT
ncbi:hypothetical protein H5410_010950 [Solanum commersonii]|uniref:Uncharacterized protein n=1 Tax=Solanum commersonii TaxID=4109 RepID=A0A9J6AN00_SOLCO|nr:hypothetical protein H5410_010950 [Solanum commersonii]